MPRSGRNRRETAIKQEEGTREMALHMQTHMQDAHKKELERNKSPQQAQAEHDAAMMANPDQRKALEAIDNAAEQNTATIDEDIIRKENEIAELRQKRASLNAPQPAAADLNDPPGTVDLSTSKDADGNDLDTDDNVVNKNAPASKHHSSKSQSSKG